MLKSEKSFLSLENGMSAARGECTIRECHQAVESRVRDHKTVVKKLITSCRENGLPFGLNAGVELEKS
jgi:hypothetical protein